MHHRVLATFAVATLVSLSPFPAVNAATTSEWQRDIQAITNDIIAIHPAPFSKIGERDWRRSAQSLLRDIPKLSEQQRVVRLMQLVASIGDGHSQIELEDSKYALWYPVRIYHFSDGYFVTAAHQSQQDLAGAKILSIAGLPADEVIDAARGLMGADNEFDKMERLYGIHNAYLMQGLGYAAADGSLEVTFRLGNGSEVTRTLQPRPADQDSHSPGLPIFDWHYTPEVFGMPFGGPDEWVSAYQGLSSSAFQQLDESRPLLLQHKTTYTKRALPESDAYYLQFNQTDDSGMAGFMGEALKEVDRQKPRRLIIDIRNNFGGDGSTVRPMIHQFIQRQNNPPWKELYLITGRKTFSAALAIVDAFIDHTDVTLVGEPPGAHLNSYGDAPNRPYPALGLRLYVSSLIHQLGNSDDYREYLPVDVPAPMSFADYSAGRDPAVDPILAGQEMRSIPTVILAEGGAAARDIYQQRMQSHGDLDWFSAPEEFAIRVAVDKLEEQGRFQEAVEGAKLNSEIHPHIWNTWYNLADSQRQAGLMEQRLGSYKCVALLAPNNWNTPAILDLFERTGIDPEPAPGCPIRE